MFVVVTFLLTEFFEPVYFFCDFFEFAEFIIPYLSKEKKWNDSWIENSFFSSPNKEIRTQDALRFGFLCSKFRRDLPNQQLAKSSKAPKVRKTLKKLTFLK